MDITREEFYRSIDGLKTDLKEDLANIQKRVDETNGRTGKIEVANENHRTRIVALEKVTFHRRRADVAGQGEEWAQSAISKRVGAMIGVGLAIIAVLLKILEVVGTKLWETLTHHV